MIGSRSASCLPSHPYFVFRKKKDKESKKRLEQQILTNETDEEENTKRVYLDKRTPAQIAFDKTQEKRVPNFLYLS